MLSLLTPIPKDYARLSHHLAGRGLLLPDSALPVDPAALFPAAAACEVPPAPFEAPSVAYHFARGKK